MASYFVDTERFAVDPSGNEVIVMDLVQGRLFLFEEGAAKLFLFLFQGADPGDLERKAGELYGETVAASVRDFSGRLIQTGILSEAPNEPGVGGVQAPLDWPESLENLVISQYDDMSNIITMDPIHDVDPGRGWPFEGTQ